MFFKISVKKNYKRYFSIIQIRWCWSQPTSKWITPSGSLTNIYLYNAFIKEKVPFIVKNKDIVNWYICGPTVYDSSHIGHACSYMRCDIIRRVMEKYFSLNVIQVMNITNIDDKIISRSSRLNMDWKLLTKNYEIEFFTDMSTLGIKLPTITARVTDFIPQIVNFISELLNKRIAYKAPDGSIYFDTQKFGKYGKLYPPPENHDVNNEILSIKRSVTDFVLWKAAKPGEPSWDGVLGPGRPGWHAECSVIATTFFGNSVDIHSGGRDLLYPHHESEEAQCCAYHGIDQWVNYWIHTGHLHLKNDNVKMSKSLGNTMTVQNFLKSYTANHLRMFCLLSSYINYIEFSNVSIGTAVGTCDKFRSFFDDAMVYIRNIDPNIGPVDESLMLAALEECKFKFTNCLEDDFNTPKAMKELMHLMSLVNVMWRKDPDPEAVRCPATVLAVSNYVKTTMENFGFDFANKKDVGDCNLLKLQSIVDLVVSFRTGIRDSAIKDIQEGSQERKQEANNILKSCDGFREELKVHGISLQDRGKLTSWSFLEKSKEEK